MKVENKIMMKKLREEIAEIMHKEYSRASEAYGPKFVSEFEAYAVIKEEIEESSEELKHINEIFENFWEEIKKGTVSKEKLEKMRQHAINLACEASQVAAMMHKTLEGFKR